MRKVIEKKLIVAYGVAKKQFPKFLLFFYIGINFGIIIFSIDKSVNSAVAIQFLGTIAEVSATILSVFCAAFIFLLGLSPKDVREAMSKRDFAASFALFSMTILQSLITILMLEENTIIVIGTYWGFFALITPLYWLTAGLLAISLFAWSLYRQRV